MRKYEKTSIGLYNKMILSICVKLPDLFKRGPVYMWYEHLRKIRLETLPVRVILIKDILTRWDGPVVPIAATLYFDQYNYNMDTT